MSNLHIDNICKDSSVLIIILFDYFGIEVCGSKKIFGEVFCINFIFAEIFCSQISVDNIENLRIFVLLNKLMRLIPVCSVFVNIFGLVILTIGKIIFLCQLCGIKCPLVVFIFKGFINYSIILVAI